MIRLRIAARDEAQADAISDVLLSALDPETTTAGLVETERGWVAEAFYAAPPEEGLLRAHLVRVLGGEAKELALTFEALADRDWVRDSLEAMPPVFAGRFAVFGGHDRERIPANAFGIEIEAAQAFGTGHHATTKGCLIALDRLLKAHRFYRPLDIGTGTGVLAIAVAKVLRIPAAATDIDPVAVAIARQNAAKNGVSGLMRAFIADGVKDARLRKGAPYDLVLANILAKPLVALAPAVARLTCPGTTAILSGLLSWQRREVEAAWRTFGFFARRRLIIDNWATLILARAGETRLKPLRRPAR